MTSNYDPNTVKEERKPFSDSYSAKNNKTIAPNYGRKLTNNEPVDNYDKNKARNDAPKGYKLDN